MATAHNLTRNPDQYHLREEMDRAVSARRWIRYTADIYSRISIHLLTEMVLTTLSIHPLRLMMLTSFSTNFGIAFALTA
jgi:flagellar biosynthesis protein FliP